MGKINNINRKGGWGNKMSCDNSIEYEVVNYKCSPLNLNQLVTNFGLLLIY